MANTRKVKQSKRAGPGRVTKGTSAAHARRTSGKTPKKHGSTMPPSPPAEISAGVRRVPVIKQRLSARLAARMPAVKPAPKSQRSSQAEKAATTRATRYSAGLGKGGQTGDRRKGGTSPSRGRRGAAPSTQTRR